MTIFHSWRCCHEKEIDHVLDIYSFRRSDGIRCDLGSTLCVVCAVEVSLDGGSFSDFGDGNCSGFSSLEAIKSGNQNQTLPGT